MPELRWNQTDFIECFGVLPETDKYETYFGYTILRQELALLVTVRPLESVVELRLLREGSVEEIISFALLVEGVVELKREKKYDFLRLTTCRVVTDRFYYLREGGPVAASQAKTLDVEIAVDPDIRISFR